MGSPLFPPLIVTRKAGCEPFRTGSQILPFDILSFWQWSSSDLASNALRGMVAEFLVAHALGIAGEMRVEWNLYDLVWVQSLSCTDYAASAGLLSTESP